MRRFVLLALLITLAGTARAQIQPQITGSGAPTNPCYNGGQQYFDTTNRILYNCSVPGQNWVNIGLGNLTGGSGGAGTGAGTALAATFNITTNCNGAANCLQWVYDDSTNNCGTATTSFMTAVNAAAVTNGATVVIGGGNANAGAYLLSSCSLTFSHGTVNVYDYATIDAGSNSGSNLIQFSDGSSGGIFHWHGGTFIGGASLTVAGMEAKNSTGNLTIDGVSWYSFGAGNATLGSCTNYAIKFDNFPFEGTVSNNLWQAFDTVTGRCFAANGPEAISNGEGTIFWLSNVIGGKDASHCASQGIIDGGYYGTVFGNNIGNIAIPIRIQGGGHRVEANQLDTEGCTANSVNAVINWGATSSSGNVDGISIVNNVAQFGSGHATNFFQQAGDSTGTISNVSLISNAQTVTSSTAALLVAPLTTNCGSTNTGQYSFCAQYGNNGLGPIPSCGKSGSTTGTGWQINDKIAYCQTSTAGANVGSTTLITVPTSGSLTPIFVNCQVLVTAAATTSGGTLPQCVISYTDFFTSVAETLIVTPVAASSAVGCTSTPAFAATIPKGYSCQGTVGPLFVTSNTAVTYSTINYAAGTGTAMVAQVAVNAYIN